MLRKQILFAYATARFCLHSQHGHHKQQILPPKEGRRQHLGSLIFQARLSAINTRSIQQILPPLSLLRIWTPGFDLLLATFAPSSAPLLISFCLLSWPTQHGERGSESIRRSLLRVYTALSTAARCALCPCYVFFASACGACARGDSDSAYFFEAFGVRISTLRKQRVLRRCKSSSNSYTAILP